MQFTLQFNYTHRISMKYVLAIISVSFLFVSCRKDSTTIHPEIRSVVEAVYATGYIAPNDEYKVYAQQDGIITAVHKNEGDTITKGDVLCDLDNDVQNAKLAASEQSYDLALLNASPASPILQELRNAMSNARTKMTDDSVNYARYSRLFAEKAISSAEYEKVSLRFTTSKKEYEMSKQRFEQTQQRLRNEMDAVKVQKITAQKDKNNVRIISDIDGMIYELYKKRGESVRKNDAIALLGSRSHIYAQLYVDENDVGKIAIGQKVAVSLDSYNGKIFDAVITKIYPILQKQNQTIRVDAEFITSPPTGIVALSAEANIIIRSNPKALTIPRSYLKGKDSVIIDNNGEKVTKHIKIGAQNFDYVEVLSGIHSSTLIVKP